MKPNLRTFYILTITQVLSIIGSAMTNVAIGIRVFNDTGDSQLTRKTIPTPR